jgi:hypothetical protein
VVVGRGDLALQPTLQAMPDVTVELEGQIAWRVGWSASRDERIVNSAMMLIRMERRPDGIMLSDP